MDSTWDVKRGDRITIAYGNDGVRLLWKDKKAFLPIEDLPETGRLSADQQSAVFDWVESITRRRYAFDIDRMRGDEMKHFRSTMREKDKKHFATSAP